jgi:hypothetical protein
MKAHEALAAVMVDVQSVAKSDRNTHQNFSFRGIDAVLNAVGPALRRHGVVVVPVVHGHTYESVEVGAKRSLMGHVIVDAEYVFVGPEGDAISCRVLGEAMDSGDKAVPKAMSVAFRTALLQALALPTDEPDPDASTYERAPAPPAVDHEQVAFRDAELNDLLAKAEDLVDREQVMAYAATGSQQLAAAKERLRKRLAEIGGDES